MRIIVSLIICLLLPTPAFAVDWVIGTPQEVVIKVSSRGGPLAGLTFSDFDVYIQCASNTTTIVDETGDTLTDNGGGAYTLNFDDDWFSSGKCDAGDQGLIWVVGTGDYLGLIAKTEEKFRAVAVTNDSLYQIFNIVDLTNEGGDQDPTTTTADTDLPFTNDISATAPKPLIKFPTVESDSRQNSNCNVQNMRTQITAYNGTTKVMTYQALPVAPDYRCVFFFF